MNTALTDASASFWTSPSLDELAHEQHVSPISDIRSLVLPSWQDEPLDDFLLFIKEQRHYEAR